MMRPQRSAAGDYAGKKSIGFVTVIVPTSFRIIIRMYWDDHPPPHFHAIYGEYEAQYTITTLDVINGALPRRAHALVVEWASLHKDALMKNWERCQIPAPAVPIEPLE